MLSLIHLRRPPRWASPRTSRDINRAIPSIHETPGSTPLYIWTIPKSKDFRVLAQVAAGIDTLGKMPLTDLTVKDTVFGFVFEAVGLPSVSYSAWIRKKSIRRFC